MMEKPRATKEQSEEFLKKIIGKTLEQADFMTRHQPFNCYVVAECLLCNHNVSRIQVELKNKIIVSGHVG